MEPDEALTKGEMITDIVAAWEQPQLLAQDKREFFRPLRSL